LNLDHAVTVYQVGGKSFVFFRNPRADATDPETGERYADVIVFWVGSESDKQAMVQDRASLFFTTATLRRSSVGVASIEPDRRARPGRTR